MSARQSCIGMTLASMLLGVPLGAYAQASPEAASTPPPAAAEPEAAPAAPPASAANRRREDLQLGTTSITGNQELPKVLYIMPWKRPDPGGGLARPDSALVDEVLEPVDRVEFRRELGYYESLNKPGK